MKHYDVIIGAQYGDEGKGLVTDFVSSQYPSSQVVRFNGGAQASHSVVRDGKRHAFSHFGSNSFLPNSTTYLSRFFIMNPHRFTEEVQQLKFTPSVSAHFSCPITTIYDMAINQGLEYNRSLKAQDERHGSCGYGINETVERTLNTLDPLALVDVKQPDVLYNKMVEIRDEYFPRRIEELQLILPKFIAKVVNNKDTVEMECNILTDNFLEIPTHFNIPEHPHIVFEGAQGLLLSEKWCEWTPHVTRSYTGIRNVLLLTDPSDSEYDIYYVTRCYTTRHGNGPLKHECGIEPYPRIVDLNNVYNPHQEHLRFAWLDIDLLVNSILDDISAIPVGVRHRINVVMTCMDQLDSSITYVQDGKMYVVSVPYFKQMISEHLKQKGVDKILFSYGPSASDIKI